MRVVPMHGEWLMDKNKGTNEKEVFTPELILVPVP